MSDQLLISGIRADQSWTICSRILARIIWILLLAKPFLWNLSIYSIDIGSSNLYNFQMYKLSRVIQAHKRDARCLDYSAGILATGGNDKHFNLYQYNNANCSPITSVDIFDAEILSIKINKSIPNSNIFLMLGCKNGDIFLFDKACNPIMKLTHNSPICSLDFIDSDRIVSGSWDGKAIVWSLTQQKPVVQYNEHKYAVAVYYSRANNWIVSGSQDKALNVWDYKTGSKIKRVQNAHNDIIREIADIEDSGMFITCSNDQSLKIWSADLQLIQTLTGHTAFVFTVKVIRLGLYVSGGQDRTLRVWADDHCQQEIHLPASVWNVALDTNGDIFAACSDGFIRTFTTDEGRRAEADVEQMFNKQILESSSKKSGMNEEEIKKLLTTNQMDAVKGKKEGEIRVFRNGMVPEAYMWQENKWVKIGDVITQGGETGGAKGQPKYYAGDKYFEEGFYDYVFDVDDESGVPKVIPFNDGANPMEAAQKYCMREGLTKGYLEQIRKFLIQNSSKVPRKKENNESQSKQLDVSQLKCTPSTGAIQYNGIKNPAALLNKLKEFNEKAEAKKLNERELVHIERIVTQLQTENTYHNWKLDFKEMDTLKKVLTWPRQIKLPVWDMLRAFLKHYQSEALFSGLEAGRDIIVQLSIGLESDYPQAIYTLILKTLSNILIQNTNKTGLLIHAETVLSSLFHLSKRSNLRSANYTSAFAAFLYNFSIACIQKNVQKQQVLFMFGDVLRMRLDAESGEDRGILLQAGANILYKYRAIVGERYHFLVNYLQADDVSSDIKMLY